MPQSIDRNRVRRLLSDGAQLVEVLPRPEYDDEHLPGAINIPLRDLSDGTTSQLRRDRPLIAYCHDSQ